MKGQTTKTPDRVAAAQAMRAHGATYREIGERFGIDFRTASDWVNDPELSRAKQRRATYRGTCVDCGAPTDGSAGPASGPAERCAVCSRELCGAIAAERERERVHERRTRLAEMWNAGKTLEQIATALDTTTDSLGKTMFNMRRDGWHLPYRYDEARREAARAGRKAAA